MEALEYINQYYINNNEDGRLLSKHGKVEFLTTMRYIQRYLTPSTRVLEVGAGTGRYSHTLAKAGYSVDSVELIQHNIDIFKSKVTPEEKITIRQGDARDLSFIESESYDITLLLGPMYRLFTEDDKLQTLKEAIRVTKKGGIVFVAYCISDASILDYGFKGGKVFELVEKNMLDLENFKARSNPWDLFELHRKEDIDKLIEGFDVTRLHYVATDLYTNHMSETVDEMSDDMFDVYLNYHYYICERSDMVGLTNHSLDIFRKN